MLVRWVSGLRAHKITPVVVFDGIADTHKTTTKLKRHKKRWENMTLE